MIRRRVTAAVVVSFAAVLVTAGCSSSGGGPAAPTTASGTPTTSTAPDSAPATSSSPAAPTSQPVTPTVPVSTAPTTATTAPVSSTPNAPTTPPTSVAPRSNCTSLMTRAITGSGVAGREFAALQFTNTGSVGCDLRGYATVTLLLKGKVIGRVSTPSGTATSARRLGPGDTAESKVNDYVMNCNAPLSDTIQVQVPGTDTVLRRPGVLRACTLRVSPLGAPE